MIARVQFSSNLEITVIARYRRAVTQTLDRLFYSRNMTQEARKNDRKMTLHHRQRPMRKSRRTRLGNHVAKCSIASAKS